MEMVVKNRKMIAGSQLLPERSERVGGRIESDIFGKGRRSKTARR